MGGLITVIASEIKINDSAITESIPASNGIIYVIDAVFLPPPSPTELPTPVPIPPPIEICPEFPCEEYRDGLSYDFGEIACCGNTGAALACACFEKEWRCAVLSPCREDCPTTPAQPTEAPPPTLAPTFARPTKMPPTSPSEPTPTPAIEPMPALIPVPTPGNAPTQGSMPKLTPGTVPEPTPNTESEVPSSSPRVSVGSAKCKSKLITLGTTIKVTHRLAFVESKQPSIERALFKSQ